MVDQNTDSAGQPYLYGTQAWSNLDDWEADDQRKLKLSTLSSRFSYSDANESQSPKRQNSSDNALVRRRKQQQKATTSSKKRKTTKIKSINDRMTKKYSTRSPLLMALSGKKHKINDLLKNIRSVEKEEHEFEKQQELSKGSALPSGLSSISSVSNISSQESSQDDINILYSKDEWHNVIRSINESFPKLSKRTKRTLDYITEKYHQQEAKEEEEEEEDDKIQLSEDVRQNSLWDSASQLVLLEKKEVELLYDFEDGAKSFYDNSETDTSSTNSESSNNDILTLSQVIRSSNKFEYVDSPCDKISEIEDSQEEVVSELTRSNLIEQAKERADHLINNIKSDSYGKEARPLIDNTETNRKDPITLSSSFSVFPDTNSESQQLEHNDNIDSVPLPGTQQDPISLSSDSTPFDLKLQKRILPGVNSKASEVQVLATVDQFSAQVTSFDADPRFPRNRTSPSRDRQVEVITSSPIGSPVLKAIQSPTKANSNDNTQRLDFSPLKSSPLKDGYKLETINQLPIEFNGNNEEVIISQSQFHSPVAKKLKLNIMDSQSEEEREREEEQEDNISSPPEFRHFFGKNKSKLIKRAKIDTLSQHSEQINDPILKTVFGKKRVNVFEIPDSDPEVNEYDEDASLQEVFSNEPKNNIEQEVLSSQNSFSNSCSVSEDDIFISCPTQPFISSRTQLLKSQNPQMKPSLNKSKPTKIPDSQAPMENSGGEDEEDKNVLPGGFFEKFSYEQLKEQTDAWGLKRIKTKKAMINMLYLTTKLMPKDVLSQSLESYTNGSSGILRFGNNDKKKSGSSTNRKNTILDLRLVHKSLYGKIRELLIENKQFSRKILIYQPLNLEEVYQFVKARLQHDQFDSKIVSKCLDELGICYTNSNAVNVEEEEKPDSFSSFVCNQ